MPQADSAVAVANDAIGPIGSIAIDGFQSLVGVDIRLAPGVNVVVGESDVGKSAVVRALQGLIGNQRGDGFINNRTGKCRVAVRVPSDDDGATVSWEKPENSYRIDDNDPFKKVGTSVPKEVLGLINMAPLELDKNSTRSINIVEQGGAKFLVEDKETDVAKTIGAITRLQPVYNAMRAVAADRRAAAGRAKTLGAEATQSRLKLAAFSDLDSEAERLGRAEKLLSRCSRLHEGLAGLRALSERLRANAADAEAIRRRLGTVEAVLGAVEHVKLARGAWKTVGRLEGLGRDLAAAAAASGAMSDRMAAIEPVADTDTSPLEADAARLAFLSDRACGLAGNSAASSELADRSAALASVAELAVGDIEEHGGRLDRIVQLRQSLGACDIAAGELNREVESADAALALAVEEVGGFLASASVCPFSGGELFSECKKLIGGAV